MVLLIVQILENEPVIFHIIDNLKLVIFLKPITKKGFAVWHTLCNMQFVKNITKSKKMKTLKTIIAITFSLISLTATANTTITGNDHADVTVNNTVKMNAIGSNGSELKFETGVNGFSVEWQTSNEINTSRFELQVTDGSKSFKTIRTVAAGAVTEWSSDYKVNFIRNYLSVEKVYYRLKTVFANGTEVYTAASSFEILAGSTVRFANVR